MCQRQIRFILGLGVALVISGVLASAEGKAADAKEGLRLSAGQKEFLWLEPILVTVRVDSPRLSGLPAAPADNKAGTLRFEIDPVVKPRSGAKPLPLEIQDTGSSAQTRVYDLLEWFSFPEKGGPWSVRAIFEQNGTKLVSEALTVSLQKPAKTEAEFEPMARLHHTPWSNYDTNAFCGDTFDLVKRWPDSRFAKYCHYWNGRYSQNKKEFDKAIESYRTMVQKYPDFVLADAAAYGVVECLYAQKKLHDAKSLNSALREKLAAKATDLGLKSGAGRTTVHRLADGMAGRLDKEIGSE
jgi:hypothetical protein